MIATLHQLVFRGRRIRSQIDLLMCAVERLIARVESLEDRINPHQGGFVLVARFEKLDEVVHHNPKTGMDTTFHYMTVCAELGDGTVTRQFINLPPGCETFALEPDHVYAFPVVPRVSRTNGDIVFTLRKGKTPLSAQEI